MTGINQSIRRSDDMPSLATFNKIAILACIVLSQYSCLTSGMTLPQQYSYKLASLEDEVKLFIIEVCKCGLYENLNLTSNLLPTSELTLVCYVSKILVQELQTLKLCKYPYTYIRK